MREMKDSGVEWIGSIPIRWDAIPAGGLFTEVKEKNKTLKYTNALQFKFGTIVDKAHVGNLDSNLLDTLSTYTCVEPDTIILNGLNLNYDFVSQRVGIVTKSGVITSAYLAVYPEKKRVSPKYASYLLKAYDSIFVFHGMGSGVRKTLQWKDFKNLKFVLPPMETQITLIEKIDILYSKTDSLIQNVQTQIEKLKAYKQSLITEVVTRGLNPTVPMKDSGVEWIGEIPEHWGTVKLQYCARIRSGITLGKRYPVGTETIERPYLRVANVQSGGVVLDNVKTVEVSMADDLQYRLSSGEVLMTEGGDRDKLGRGCVWQGQIEPCLHQNHIFALQPNDLLDSQFLAYMTASNVGRVYFDITAIKTTNLACTNSSKVLAFRFPLPGKGEQTELVDYLDKKCAQIDRLIAIKQAKIEKLEQYKRSLIYEYVTGKKEVRL